MVEITPFWKKKETYLCTIIEFFLIYKNNLEWSRQCWQADDELTKLMCVGTSVFIWQHYNAMSSDKLSVKSFDLRCNRHLSVLYAKNKLNFLTEKLINQWLKQMFLFFIM